MIRFDCDYNQSAHPRILARLQEIAGEQHPGYGTDTRTEQARAYIRTAINAPEADVHFLVGGTQANAVLIGAVLRPHQGVISADTGHIATHETGAIEATGHKVLILPGTEGKLTAAQIQQAYDNHQNDPTHEHDVQPGMVYISHPTESGTVYTLAELEAISKVCRACHLPLMLDGARLGYGLAAHGTDVTLPDIARLCDMFYIGGTKVGALFGEAVVIQNPRYQPDFRYLIKRHGGLLAKGFLLGVQFECLFEDGLYFQLGRHGVGEAMYLRQGLLVAGLPLQYDTGTNQQFPRVPDALAERLAKDFAFARWEKPNEQESVIRLCTSWATQREEVDALIAALG
ncbi:MAG: aminotransferase class I/II-fold pyridoxal phosphate-dependent enzyme [Oscillospiraceae bacterium]|nr:aminotransferase class I/II-fold pyridoxal phosphate-dependent enzyme [Oscillospiraceae bacterium]